MNAMCSPSLVPALIHAAKRVPAPLQHHAVLDVSEFRMFLHHKVLDVAAACGVVFHVRGVDKMDAYPVGDLRRVVESLGNVRDAPPHKHPQDLVRILHLSFDDLMGGSPLSNPVKAGPASCTSVSHRQAGPPRSPTLHSPMTSGDQRPPVESTPESGWPSACCQVPYTSRFPPP